MAHKPVHEEIAATPADRRRATVAVGFVTGMLSGLAAHHIDYGDLLAASGINPDLLSDPDGRVPLKDYATLYTALVRQLDDEGFALFPAPLRSGTFEFLCRSMVSSQT